MKYQIEYRFLRLIFGVLCSLSGLSIAQTIFYCDLVIVVSIPIQDRTLFVSNELNKSIEEEEIVTAYDKYRL